MFMCLSPRLVKNPLYKQDKILGSPISDWQKLVKNYNDAYIYVPCGTCAECLQSKQNSFIQRAIMELRFSHMYYITLTYKDDAIPIVETSKGELLRYPDSCDIQNMFKRIRFYNSIDRHFSYCAFSEYGGKTHRPHWHILLFIEKYDKDDYIDIVNYEQMLWKLFFNEWKRNFGSDKRPVWQPLFEYHCRGKFRNYDCHYVNPLSSKRGELDVAFYVTKYLLKVSKYEAWLMCRLRETLPYLEYREIRSKVRCKHLVSKKFGYNYRGIKDYIRYCLDLSLQLKLSSPVFVNPLTGKHFPLSRYYKERLIEKNDAVQFAKNGDVYQGSKTWTVDTERNVQFKHDRFAKNLKRISDHDTDVYELF